MKPDCGQYKDSFSALIDKQLDLPNVSAVEEHLVDCQDCSEHLDQMRLLSRTLSNCLSDIDKGSIDIWMDVADKMPNLCELVQGEMSNFLDGELVLASQEGVRGHLKECNVCLKQFRDLNTTNRLIAEGMNLSSKTQIDLWPLIRTQLNEDCNVIENDLSAFVDQQMPTERHRIVTAHILECPRCSETVRSFSRLGTLMENLYKPPVLVGPELLGGVKSKLQVVPFTPKQQAKPSNRFPTILVASIAAGLGGIALLCFAMVATGRPQAVSCERVLIHTAFAQTPDSPEAAVYEH